jgi:hypothetical protein
VILVAYQRVVNARTGCRDPVVPLKIPSDPLGTKVIPLPEMENLLDNLRLQLSRMAPGHRPLPDQTSFPLFGISPLPTVESRPWNCPLTVDLGTVAQSLSQLQNQLLQTNILTL